MLLSLVIPVFNEVETLGLLFPALKDVLRESGCSSEIVFVDDGSLDGSSEILDDLAGSDVTVKVLHFSRNFGHQAAVTAGLDFARGDAVVIMDADLQDPPAIIHQMLELYRAGFEVVSAQRISRASDSPFKSWTAKGFYWLMKTAVDKRVQPEVGDFRLLSRVVVDAVCQFREQHRFMRGLIAWLGFREAVVPFHRQARAAGETKYPLSKMLRFAWTAISSFSALPLRLTVLLGALFMIGGGFYLAYALFTALVVKSVVPGWTSLVCIQIIFSGITLFAIGMVGDYVARIYEEAKARPLYVVSSTRNLALARDQGVRTYVAGRTAG